MPAGNGKLMRASSLEASFGRTPTVPFPTAAAGTTSVWLSLHTADPGDDGQTATELSTSGTNYLRINVPAANWAAAVVGANDVAVTIATSVVVRFPASLNFATAAGTVTYLGAWRDVSATTSTLFVGRIPVTPGQVISIGSNISFAIGAIQFTDNSS